MAKRRKKLKAKPKRPKRKKRAATPALDAKMAEQRDQLAGTAHADTLAWLVDTDIALPMGKKGRGVMEVALRFESTSGGGVEADALAIKIYKDQMVAMMLSKSPKERYQGVRSFQSAMRLRNTAISKKLDLLLGLMEEEGGVLSSEAEGRHIEGDTPEAAGRKLEQEFNDAQQQLERLRTDVPDPDPGRQITQQQGETHDDLATQ